MSSLSFLESRDFFIKQSKLKDGNIMCNKIHGMSVCFFYSPNCPYSKQLLPVFKNIRINNVHLAFVNVELQRQVVLMSQHTKAPIRFTPVITMYYNGTPYCNFDNSKSMNGHTIEQFILNCGSQIQKILKAQEEVARSQPPHLRNQQYHIPDYSLGIPVSNDPENVTYLLWKEFIERYEVEPTRKK